MHDIQTELSKRILILDGAMGTMLQRKGLQGNSESFNLTNPETIGEIHNEYIEAGADIITANSFSANSISQSEYNLSEKAGQMAEAAARIARKAAGRTLPWSALSACARSCHSLRQKSLPEYPWLPEYVRAHTGQPLCSTRRSRSRTAADPHLRLSTL